MALSKEPAIRKTRQWIRELMEQIERCFKSKRYRHHCNVSINAALID